MPEFIHTSKTAKIIKVILHRAFDRMSTCCILNIMGYAVFYVAHA